MANPQIIVEYVAKTTGLNAATSDIESGGSKVKKTMAGVGKAVAAGFAVGAAVSFGKAAVGAAEESAQATARLDNVFKQMGDTTGKASQAAQDYASELSAQTAIEDEAIMSAQAMLATFGKVSNETARQAGIFDRATAAAADLAAAGFGSLESNATQLGKALQDPVKGLAALARSGVTFSEAQKEQIKSLVESNRHLEAQQIVLGAIEGQVKGTAAATATESEKMKVAFGEVQESVGMALLPVLQELAPVLAKVAKFIADNSRVIVPLVAVVGGLVAIIKVATAVQIAWNFAMSANPIGLVVIAIGALVAAIVLLVKNWGTVTAAFNKGFAAIKSAALEVFGWIKANWPLLLGILTGPFGLAVALIIKHWDRLADGARDAVNAIKSAVGTIADAIMGQVGRVSRAVERIVNAIKGPINAVLGAWNRISFSVPRFEIPSVTVLGKKIGGGSFGGQSFGVPQIPLLAKGGVVSSPTLLVAGEGRGREIIAPEGLLRQIMGEQAVNVRVFIGDRELRDLVRVEVVDANTGLARTLLAGATPA